MTAASQRATPYELGLGWMGWARYATPLPRYWMCGSGTHPGGGIMGAPGKLAALRLLGERLL